MYEFADEVGTIAGRRTPPVGADAISRYARFHDPFNHPTVVYRRQAVKRAGGYLPLGLMEDYYLFARMIQSGARVENLPDPLVMYRVSAGAYARRGGVAQLVAELRLQREFRRRRFTSLSQALRNVLVRGSYRLIPEAVRRGLYRRLITRDRTVPQGRA
ncbi:UDP-Gal:alpha-D-GlcNAc-diphosphoundecaprenol beta-1,3-galactosyltransferase [Clavibacter michiganensis subsp. michiganensis]|nr:UDP-Gal:alpha-D-GlcNAc-diphosphoundecaprenol beta-1,3-galactosyltransferase [Clavibacter michiganensis subsp. michiganensis]OUD99290.1 UDP-Gal:alpha-D-GlcNAc-diphosphoundecaprenol beta-1,3-galactosyltransferase [Clavibacter michiganensis subsp. michiganensis]